MVPIVNVMNPIHIVPINAVAQMIVPVDKFVPVANVVRNAIVIVLALWVNFVKEVPALLAASPITIVPMISPALRDNAQIHVPMENPVDVMPCVRYPIIVCCVIVLMVLMVSPARNVYPLSASKIRIVMKTSVVMQENAEILAWNMEHVVSMPSVVWLIARLSAHVLPISLVILCRSVNHWRVDVPTIHVEPIPDVLRFLVVMSVLALRVAWVMPTRVVFVRILK